MFGAHLGHGRTTQLRAHHPATAPPARTSLRCRWLSRKPTRRLSLRVVLRERNTRARARVCKALEALPLGGSSALAGSLRELSLQLQAGGPAPQPHQQELCLDLGLLAQLPALEKALVAVPAAKVRSAALAGHTRLRKLALFYIDLFVVDSPAPSEAAAWLPRGLVKLGLEFGRPAGLPPGLGQLPALRCLALHGAGCRAAGLQPLAQLGGNLLELHLNQ